MDAQIEAAIKEYSKRLEQLRGKVWDYAPANQQSPVEQSGSIIQLKKGALLDSTRALGGLVLVYVQKDCETLAKDGLDGLERVQGFLAEYYLSAVVAGALTAWNQSAGSALGRCMFQSLILGVDVPFEKSLTWSMAVDTIANLATGSESAMRRVSMALNLMASALEVDESHLVILNFSMGPLHLSLAKIALDAFRKAQESNLSRRGCGAAAVLAFIVTPFTASLLMSRIYWEQPVMSRPARGTAQPARGRVSEPWPLTQSNRAGGWRSDAEKFVSCDGAPHGS